MFAAGVPLCQPGPVWAGVNAAGPPPGTGRRIASRADLGTLWSLTSLGAGPNAPWGRSRPVWTRRSEGMPEAAPLAPLRVNPPAARWLSGGWADRTITGTPPEGWVMGRGAAGWAGVR